MTDELGSTSKDHAAALAKHLVTEIQKYREKHICKFLGAGLTSKLADMSPQLPSLLWLELDIVPFVFNTETPTHFSRTRASAMTVDEEADFMARECLG